MTEGTTDPTKHREKGSTDLWAIPYTGFRFRVPEPTKSGNAKAEHFAPAYLKAVTTCCLLAKEYTSRASVNLSSSLTPLLYLWCVWIGCFFFFLPWSLAAAAAKLLQSCPTPRSPMDCSLPGSSAHGVFQARVLEWVALAFSMIISENPLFWTSEPWSRALLSVGILSSPDTCSLGEKLWPT